VTVFLIVPGGSAVNWCSKFLEMRRGINEFLVGGFNHLEKYESQWEGLSHILWKNMKNKKCLKPPTRFVTIDTSPQGMKRW